MKQLLAVAGTAALVAMSAAAQDTAQADKMKAEIQAVLERSKIMAAGGGVMGRTVKGAPYSGQEVNETTQTLGDGTRIHNETRANVYRDSEGRVRRESGDTVTIWDPVANVNYTLNTKSMTGTKTSMMPAVFMRQPMAVAGGFGHGTGVSVGGAGGTGAQVSVQDGMLVITKDGKTEKIPFPANGEWTSEDGKIHAVIHQSTDAAGVNHTGFTVQQGEVTVVENGVAHTLPSPPAGSAVRLALTNGPVAKALDEAKLKKSLADGSTQQLGDQNIEGVKSHGTRTTNTIAAGAIGNDRPLTTVAERWYSDELQTEILNKRTDPRTGETIFKLINVSRSEPGAYLFQPPNGYTINERK